MSLITCTDVVFNYSLLLTVDGPAENKHERNKKCFLLIFLCKLIQLMKNAEEEILSKTFRRVM